MVLKYVFCMKGWMGPASTTELCFDPPPQKLESNRVVWHRKVPAHGRGRIATTVTMHVSDEAEPAAPPAAMRHPPTFEEMHARSTMQNADWRQACTHFRSDNDIFDVLLQTSTEDFYSLRMPEPAGRRSRRACHGLPRSSDAIH